MMDIGIRKIFNEDHDMFRQTARRFFKEQVVPYLSQYVKMNSSDAEMKQFVSF